MLNRNGLAMEYPQQLVFLEPLGLQYLNFSHPIFPLLSTVQQLLVLLQLNKQPKKCLQPKLHLLHI